MAWVKRGNARNITEVIKEISRLSLREVHSPVFVDPGSIMNMEVAGNMILRAIKEKIPITIVGDYDADGITSTAILCHALRYLGSEPHVRLPKRYSEGYGLSMHVVDEIASGLIIAVDNGISAIEQIKAAKEKGLSIIILDHHLPGDTLPMADVIVDPHIDPEKSGFADYCGAGLAFKLAQIMIQDRDFLRKMCALAAIGTVADVVPLISDNRVIVRNGLKYINWHTVPVGLMAVLNAVGVDDIDEQTIGFTIGPLLNAPGRLYDDGAIQSLEMLITEDYAEAEAKAYALIETNNLRKDLLKAGMERAHKTLQDSQNENRNPIVLYDPELLSGLAGLVAGRLSEEFKTPAIVLTRADEDGILKGSARSYGDIHLKHLLDQVRNHLKTYGGHAGAAGLSLKEDNLQPFTQAIEALLSKYERPDGSVIYYDLEVKLDDVSRIAKELKRYAPYGEGNPRPIIKIDEVILLPQAGKLYRTMGDNDEHIKLFGKSFSVVGFNMTEQFIGVGEPNVVNTIGYLSQKSHKGSERVEMEALAIEKGVSKDKQETELQKQLMIHLFNFIDDRR